MKLIGMLDSPYVRRAVISLRMLGLKFEHQSLSVFSTYTEFQRINPVVKAPTLVCDDGTYLMDSTLIIEYAEALAQPHSLMSSNIRDKQYELHIVGLALAACEKSVQIIYERNLRPSEKQHQPWVARVTEQLLAAYSALEVAITQHPLASPDAAMGQAGISTAVAWYFTQKMLPEIVRASDFPNLVAYSKAAEALPVFLAAPHGD
ncbi:glutathione S-transferase [Rhodoferax sp. GW822-FHT02A01]|uniref:glutathione S-transferase n=1 Tax=Rhodoferax sp. GW822-FHT02A01 TaxID=3141537 RepID=UPI00315DC940